MTVKIEYDKKRAMKQKDFTPCKKCGKGVMHTGIPLFYRITVEQMGVDGNAVRKAHGLEMMLGRAAPLGQVLGLNEDIGIPIGDPSKGLLCMTCSQDINLCLGEVMEILNKETKDG